MTRRPPGRSTGSRTFLIAAWWTISSVVSLTLVVHAALGPLSLLWDTAVQDQEGQLVFYNFRTGGGFYGLPVEIGDYDGDGFADLVIAPMGASSGPDGSRVSAGEIYVRRGDGRLEGAIERGAFTNETFPGLTILGARPLDFLGTELYTADVNGDRIQDLLVSAQNYDGPAAERTSCGGAFVILGREGLLEDGSVVDLAFDPASPPPGVITIFGEREGDRLGVWVHAGDIDGDGIDDLLLGADQSRGGTPTGEVTRTGMAVVVYGRETFPPIIDLGEGPGSLSGLSFIYGRDPGDHFGSTISSGDLDGDGREELIISASMHRLSGDQDDFPSVFAARGLGGADGPGNDRPDAGEVTIFFTGGVPEKRLPTRVDLAQPLPGGLEDRLAIIHGAGRFELAGEELEIGDFDGDGTLELVLGAISADNPDGAVFAGATYVIYRPDLLRGEALDLADPKSAPVPQRVHVARLYGANESDIFGDTLSVGDFNRDGFDDLAIGIPHAEPEGRDDAGEVAIVFGNPSPFPDNFFPSLGELEGGPLLAYVQGPDAWDNFSYSMEARDYDDDGYADLFPNSMRGDGPRGESPDAGEVYLVSGFRLSGQEVRLDRAQPARAVVGQPFQTVLTGGGFTRSGDTVVTLGEQGATNVEVRSATVAVASFAAPTAPGSSTLRIENRHGSAVLAREFTIAGDDPFIRADVSGDGKIEIDDAIQSLEYQFLGAATTCLDAHDVNDDGALDISDPLASLFYQFLGGDPPPPPFPAAGPDPTPDSLGCP